MTNEDLGRDAHWFDGDGMLSGVAFRRTEKGLQPEFVNQFILTDMYLSSISSPRLKSPPLPSVATLVNPLSTLYTIILRVIRTIMLVVLSHLPGSVQVIKRISVANTGILYHDGRALATCESGPPMRVSLPGLETIGWYNGKRAEGEHEGEGEAGSGFGGEGLLSFMKEWTTAHPRVDPRTGELVLFHSTFAPPYVHYSAIPATKPPTMTNSPMETPTRLLNAPVPGVSSAKMMHDFGVSFDHTVIMDLPVSLDPLNLAKNKPVVSYNPIGGSRFGVFPRHQPEQVRWFETDSCCIFHTANTWDEKVSDKSSGGLKTQSVNMLTCRLTSASLIYSAGDVEAPIPDRATVPSEEEQCRLYYYNFHMGDDTSTPHIRHQFALSAIPFEFPSICESKSMEEAKYIYGCSTSSGSFSAALGRAVKIDRLIKINAETLIKHGKKDGTLRPVTGCVDERTAEEVLRSKRADDPIQVFELPAGHNAQECRFVQKANAKVEDEGYLLFYVFDESQLDESGECRADSRSELWVVDAQDMKTVVCKIILPQRVPYGLHGNWFPEQQVLSQRPVESIRHLPKMTELDSSEERSALWRPLRRRIESFVG